MHKTMQFNNTNKSGFGYSVSVANAYEFECNSIGLQNLCKFNHFCLETILHNDFIGLSVLF